MLQMFITGQMLASAIDGDNDKVHEFFGLLDQFEPNDINLALPNDADDFSRPSVRADRPTASKAPHG